MLKNLLLLSRILTSVYELLRIITSYLRIPASYLQMLVIDSPFTYTDFSYEFLRMAQIHGSLRFGHFYDRFKSCYELLRTIYDLLGIITMYLRKNSTICYVVSRITMSNLRGFYEFITDCYEYITECYYSSKPLRFSYNLFTCCYE